jgi:hypothetical protein
MFEKNTFFVYYRIVKKKEFNLEDYIESKTINFRQKVRDKAFKKAENSLIRHGRLQSELSHDEWESLVFEEEREIWSQYKKGSIGAIIALAFWVP